MDLPLSNTEVLAIQVRMIKQTLVPRIFSKPLLPFTLIPLDFRYTKQLNILLALKFSARVWKLLFEAHQGYDWMVELANERSSPVKRGQPQQLQIPSPRVREDGYHDPDFLGLSDVEDSNEGSGPVSKPPPVEEVQQRALPIRSVTSHISDAVSSDSTPAFPRREEVTRILCHLACAFDNLRMRSYLCTYVY